MLISVIPLTAFPASRTTQRLAVPAPGVTFVYDNWVPEDVHELPASVKLFSVAKEVVVRVAVEMLVIETIPLLASTTSAELAEQVPGVTLQYDNCVPLDVHELPASVKLFKVAKEVVVRVAVEMLVIETIPLLASTTSAELAEQVPGVTLQ